MSDLPLDALRALAAEGAAATPGIVLVVLFGSVAAGSARADSDADIAVLGGDSWKALELGSSLAARIGREPHVVDLGDAPDALRFEIARGGVMLFEAEPYAWARFQAEAAIRYFGEFAYADQEEPSPRPKIDLKELGLA